MKLSYPSRRKILSIGAYVILAITIAYIMVHRYTPSLSVGTQAPLSDKITLLNASTTSFSTFKKPMLINFWATWCTPCQHELPVLERLAQKYSQQITFIGAAVDSPRADIISAQNTLKLDYIIGEVSAQVTKNWRAQLLPTTYLIDSFGTIIWAHAGLLKEEELEKAIALILK